MTRTFTSVRDKNFGHCVNAVRFNAYDKTRIWGAREFVRVGMDRKAY